MGRNQGQYALLQRIVDVGAQIVDCPVHPVEVIWVIGPEFAEALPVVLTKANNHRVTVLLQTALIVQKVAANVFGEVRRCPVDLVLGQLLLQHHARGLHVAQGIVGVVERSAGVPFVEGREGAWAQDLLQPVRIENDAVVGAGEGLTTPLKLGLEEGKVVGEGVIASEVCIFEKGRDAVEMCLERGRPPNGVGIEAGQVRHRFGHLSFGVDEHVHRVVERRPVAGRDKALHADLNDACLSRIGTGRFEVEENEGAFEVKHGGAAGIGEETAE